MQTVMIPASVGGHAYKLGVIAVAGVYTCGLFCAIFTLLQVSWKLTGKLFKTLSVSLMWIVNSFGGRIEFTFIMHKHNNFSIIIFNFIRVTIMHTK